MNISEIKINPNNPRIIKDDKFKTLVNSIRDFPKMMKLRPIIVDNENIVLGGNMRLKALQELKFKEIPDEWVKRADELTEEEKKRFIIADNVNFGEFDWDMLEVDFNIDELSDWGLEMQDFESFNIASDDDLISKSNDRGGMDANGIKFVLGNCTRFIKDTDENYEAAKELENTMLNATTNELTEIICKILNVYTSSENI